ncbi:tRNA glutamyl-Q(34) synthetase GluQRS [Pelagivirga sediminicola]|uniref:tRNA glutamyl-Q(34) synthetase GluQRS n=1 Tax=Pelagivirga sediminicola TaxID=2170575 RepID=A0A2T7GB62_9RHOB|nr:tRNA glutamyl-Q(34) synthetase GluQRS [Pelagivirga sediminicola]PVA11649.1 tRNA glutamyl-Q(34) synthetase GluQRS [Pelagivirga sediminicola]
MLITTRFAPSPTGPLHLGHAYSAILAHDLAAKGGGTFLLRIEDIDQSRSRPQWEAQIFNDLIWLGLDWPRPVMRQSERMPVYRRAIDDLWQRGLLYPCSCTRRDIAASASAPQEGAPMTGPDGVIYPGTCRPPQGWQPENAAPPPDSALRLDMRAAMTAVDEASPAFVETGSGTPQHTGLVQTSSNRILTEIGDIVLARPAMGTSYHLSVVLDDAQQGITCVTRGADLFDATAIHVILQRLLRLPTPEYHHHRLIRDDAGKRLAKRDDARAIALYRENGATPQDIRRMLDLA